jgi:flagellar hook-length control protein FliK
VASDTKPKAATLASTSRAALLQSTANAPEVPVQATGASVTSASSVIEALPVTTTAHVETTPGLASVTAPAAPAESSVEAPATLRPTLQTLGDFAVKSVRYINTQGGETITVRLVPESLGELRVVVKSGSDGLEIELSSRNQVVRETLERQLPALQEAFARDGTDVARITVSASSAFDADGSAGRPSQQAGNQAPSSGSGQGRGNSPSANTYGTEERPRTTAPPHDGALNVFA